MASTRTMGGESSKAQPEASQDQRAVKVTVYTDFKTTELADVDPTITILDLKKKLANVISDADKQSVIFPANVLPNLMQPEAVKFYTHSETIVPDDATLASCGFCDVLIQTRVKVLGLAATREAIALVPQEPLGADLVTDINLATRNNCVFRVRCAEPTATTVAQLKAIAAQRLGFSAGATCSLEYKRAGQMTPLGDDSATLASYAIESGVTIELTAQPESPGDGGR